MTKLFYTCPTKAAYMAKEFGVKYKPHKVKVNSKKIYVAQESEHIFEKRFDDVTIEMGSGKGTKAGSDGQALGYDLKWYRVREIIIFRDGKIFLMPEYGLLKRLLST